MKTLSFSELGSAYLAHYARRLSDLINEQSIVLMKQLNLITPPSSVSTMHYIQLHKQVTGSQLAEDLGVTHQMATQRINALINLDLIKRYPSEQDQRAKVVRLTARGKKEIIQLEEFTQHMNQLFTELEQEVGYPLSQLLLKTEKILRDSDLTARFHKQQENI